MVHATIYLDECVDHDVIPFLRARGVSVETAQGRAQQQTSDDAQVRFATMHGWVILTTNAEHFRKVHRRFARMGISHGGIVTLPQEAIHQPRFFLRCAMLIDWVYRHYPDPRNHVLRWSDLQRELDRKTLVLSGYDDAHIAYASGQTVIPPTALMREIARSVLD
jgi:hypothetical protein